ncbi:hypothetical protein HUU40_00020 [candidate division KSB1 bacterium]|nr:hypothetical protein [candidate division KSB1 bacterium]
MKQAEITITRKHRYDVKVHSASYYDESLPEPEFEGQIHAVLIRNLDPNGRFNGGGATFYEAKDGKWEGVTL